MVTSVIKILVCDDKPEQCEQTASVLSAHDTVVRLSGDGLTKALAEFFTQVENLLRNDSMASHDASPFDDYDILIVDNNLTELDLKGARLTAETIIGYLRAFSNTPYIISLNKNLHVDFDLRYLFGDYQSLADIALNTSHLSNECLWGSRSNDSFSPWYWPRLDLVPHQRRQQIQFLQTNLESSVWDSLRFPESAAEYLTYRATSALSSSRDQSFRETKFEEFFINSRSLTPAENNTLKQKLETAPIRHAVCAITAYEIDRWIRRDLLGPQDVLIDIPHLITQFPMLLGEESTDLNDWNRAIVNDGTSFGLDRELFENHIQAHQFSEDIWAPKPCFWWPTLAGSEELRERFLNSEETWPNAVFCEDTSRFVEYRVGEEPHSPKEFETEISGSWGRRYIEYRENLSYSPRNRILEEAS